MKRSQLGVMLSMFAVFGSGIVVGALGYHSYSVKTVTATAPAQQPKRNPSPEDWRKAYVEELRQRLQLDATQVTGLNVILDETRSRFRNLKEQQKQASDLARNQIRSEQTEKVHGILKPAQRPEYDKFREERERKMKAEQAAREAEAKAQAGKAGN